MGVEEFAPGGRPACACVAPSPQLEIGVSGVCVCACATSHKTPHACYHHARHDWHVFTMDWPGLAVHVSANIIGMYLLSFASLGLAARPDCGPTSHRALASITAESSFPGGAARRTLGLEDVADDVALFTAAKSSDAEERTVAGRVAAARAGAGVALLHAAAAAAVAAVPSSIGPPTWNSKPLPCVPLTVGHQCVGAVLHPISAVDFVMAEETDKAISSRAAAFPVLYAARVGRTEDEAYSKCFRSYMSLHCAAAFPACTVLQAEETNSLGSGRAPLCFAHCLDTLVSCPGFWVDDISDVCADVSGPPSCSSASYGRTAPQQLSRVDDAYPQALGCQ